MDNDNVNMNDKDASKTRKILIFQNMFVTCFGVLTGGVFLSGLAILLGANDVVVGYIGIMPNICWVLIFPFSYVLENVINNKKSILFTIFISRFTTCIVISIPFLIKSSFKLYVFLLIIVLSLILQSLSTIVINHWIVQCVQEKTRGRYMSKRQTFSLVVLMASQILCGIFIDSFKNKLEGFSILFAIAFFISLAEILILSKAKYFQMKSNERRKFGLNIFLIPARNNKFISYLIYIFLFYLFLYISDSFTTVYLIKYLKLDYTTIMLFQLIMNFPQLILLSMWGKFSDKYGHKQMLFLSITFFIGETLFLGFSTQKMFYVFVPIAFIFAACGNSGFQISLFNRRYEIIPNQARVIYDCFFYATIAIAFLLGPFVGGVIKSAIERYEIFHNYLNEMQILYFISALAILLLQLNFFKSMDIKKLFNKPAQ